MFIVVTGSRPRVDSPRSALAGNQPRSPLNSTSHHERLARQPCISTSAPRRSIATAGKPMSGPARIFVLFATYPGAAEAAAGTKIEATRAHIARDLGNIELS